ncbi:hypothetical protein [Rhodococcus erythropolis]|uniref:hypothetical protein n=1 Tax=Rhodococcus erythropolis TaxID=1833 RepID=UPI0008791EAB|nr:hypothetical protein [Rhodococcus erythropolis]
MTATPFTKFVVDGLDGIVFTAEFDRSKNWLTISGHDRDGDLVSKSALSVTPDPIEDIALTPEIEPTSDARDATLAYLESNTPHEEGGDDGSQ